MSRMRYLIFVFAAALFLGVIALWLRSPNPQTDTPSLAPRAASNAPSSLPSPPPSVQALGSPPLPGNVLQSVLSERLASFSNDEVLRQNELEQIAAAIPFAELERTLEILFDRRNEPAARGLSDLLLRRWALESPALAASWISHKDDSDFQRSAAQSVAIVWANKNPADAADWVRQWPEERRAAGILAVAQEASGREPRQALTLAAELPRSPERDQLIRAAVSNWASADSTSATAWAAKLDPSPLRDEVIAGLGLAVAETDPKAAAQLAIETLPPGKTQNDTVVGIVQRWAQKSPAEAAQWVDAFPDGPLRVSAAENLVQIWTEQSPEEAGGWLNQMPEGLARDSAVAAYLNKVAASSPEAAAEWLNAIDDPERRARETEALAERWLLMDESAAATWIAASEMPAALKDRLLSRSAAKEGNGPSAPVLPPK